VWPLICRMHVHGSCSARSQSCAAADHAAAMPPGRAAPLQPSQPQRSQITCSAHLYPLSSLNTSDPNASSLSRRLLQVMPSTCATYLCCAQSPMASQRSKVTSRRLSLAWAAHSLHEG
jgi:hypothetical protein